MPRFVNCGVSHSDGVRIKTKKALREALKFNPALVTFDKTSPFDLPGTDIRGSEIPDGIVLSVVGPDPYRDRRWYASVSKSTDGTVKVA